jgi:hypothetical protein
MAAFRFAFPEPPTVGTLLLWRGVFWRFVEAEPYVRKRDGAPSFVLHWREVDGKGKATSGLAGGGLQVKHPTTKPLDYGDALPKEAREQWAKLDRAKAAKERRQEAHRAAMQRKAREVMRQVDAILGEPKTATVTAEQAQAWKHWRADTVTEADLAVKNAMRAEYGLGPIDMAAFRRMLEAKERVA